MPFIKKQSFLLLIFLIMITFNFSLAEESVNFKDKKPLLYVKEANYNMGTIRKGTEFGHNFLFENRGKTNLRLLKAVANTPGDIQVRMPSLIPAGDEKYVYIGQNSDNIRGPHTLEVFIKTNDPLQPEILLTLAGYIQWPVEILPRPLALMKIRKGQEMSKTFTLVNHTRTPMKLEKIEYDKEVFQLEIKEMEKGKKFELIIQPAVNVPLGEHRTRMIFHTNIAEAPQVSMAAWLKVRERIFTNIQVIDFGERPLQQISDQSIVELTTEIVIINGMSTPGFKVLKVECDVDFLVAELSPIAKNQVHRVDVYFQPEKARAGAFSGTLRILTNDEEFKQIIIPIRGKLY